jgi:hypothetical protein
LHPILFLNSSIFSPFILLIESYLRSAPKWSWLLTITYIKILKDVQETLAKLLNYLLEIKNYSFLPFRLSFCYLVICCHACVNSVINVMCEWGIFKTLNWYVIFWK